MAVSESFSNYVLEQLIPFGPVIARKMFGGMGLFCNNIMFGLIANDVLYFKMDDSNRADYINSGMGPFKPFANKPMVMPYFEVPADVLEDRTILVSWAAKAFEVAIKSSKGKKRF